MHEFNDALETLLALGREASEIGVGQMMLRAVIIYSVTLAVVRLGSKRFLGKATAFDVILGIMIGSVMSRAINGSAGLLPTLAAGAVLIALHGVFARLSYRTDWFGNYVKGRPVLLVEDGRVQPDGMQESSVSENDLAEALRLQGLKNDTTRVQTAYLERDGTISVIPRKEELRVLEIVVVDGVQTVRLELS